MVATRRDAAAPWRHVDPLLAFATVALAVVGLVLVYSATRNGSGGASVDPYRFVEKQAMFTVLGLFLMVVATFVDYRRVVDHAPLLYGGAVLVLLAVVSPVGSSSKGAQAWFQVGSFQLQPSEFAKIVFIVCLAAYGAQHRGELDGRRLLQVLVLGGVPMGLILLQPDLGTALMGVLLVGGARPKHLAVLVLLGVVGTAGVLQADVLKEYQKDRLTAFLDPKGDPRLSSYNLRQSEVAISAGGLTGQGLFQGTQTNLSYVPEQHTDFIFTVAGEELGFAGAAVLLALFAVVVWRTWRAAVLARDLTGTLLCVGVLCMLMFQIFENVGMTMGIMPITGIPLPFLSYGGSAMLASFVGVGLVLNVHMRRFS